MPVIGLRRPALLSTLALAAVVTVSSCAGPAARTDSGVAGAAAVAPRTPVLSPCPAAGAAAGLPRLALRCLGPGPAVDPARLGGAPVLVNLWASWCLPCQREMPALQRAYLQHGTPLRFLGVDTEDDADSAKDFLAAVGVHYPQLVDDRGDLLHRLGGAGLPVTVVLNARGAVVFTHRGQLSSGDLSAAVAAAR